MSTQEARDRAEERRLAQQQAIEDEERRESLTQPGISLSKFKGIWGDPDQVEFMDETTIYWYENGEAPTYFYFKNDKLTGRKLDRGTIDQNREIARQDEIRRQDAEQRRREEVGRAIQQGFQGAQKGFQPVQQPRHQPTQKTRCTSNPQYDGSVVTTCD